MLPSVKLVPNNSGKIPSSTGITSRSYTFLDSYIYMKNERYNALYEKNKEILGIENVAIKAKSADYLYDAFMEQVRIIESVVTRMRNFAFTVRNDVIENMHQILPSNSDISKFDSALAKSINIPKFKYISYKISPIKYAGMTTFYNLFNNELNQLTTNKNSENNILPHNKATEYLTDIIKNKNDTGLLSSEHIGIMTYTKLVSISNFFKKSGQLFTALNRDFKTYQFYLRTYNTFYSNCEKIKPSIDKYGNIIVNGRTVSFNDYIVIYKHFSSLVKYILDVITYYDTQFYNKIYAIQSNIEMYRSMMDYVIEYANAKENNKAEPAKESLTEAWWDGYMNSDVIDAHSLINGNSQAQDLLWDDSSDIDEIDDGCLNEDKLEDKVFDSELDDYNKELMTQYLNI